MTGRALTSISTRGLLGARQPIIEAMDNESCNPSCGFGRLNRRFVAWLLLGWMDEWREGVLERRNCRGRMAVVPGHPWDGTLQYSFDTADSRPRFNRQLHSTLSNQQPRESVMVGVAIAEGQIKTEAVAVVVR